MTQKEAIEIIKMGNNVFLTGEAGTGKTHALLSYINFLKTRHIPAGITASTGIAATHLDGVTIDSWSGIGIRNELTEKDWKDILGKYHLKKRICKAKVLIIDEVSMIHGRRFDLINQLIKKIRADEKPFGGLQVILCGDFFQLPPVSEDKNNVDYIFKSEAWKQLELGVCYLTEPRRHHDEKLLQILRDIRRCSVSGGTITDLTGTRDQKFPSGFIPTKLYTHNVDVDRINLEELGKIVQEEHSFFMSSLGPDKLIEAMRRACLAPEKLLLKKEALVMFVRNNFEQGYVNGTLGKVTGFDHNGDPVVKTFNGNKITVTPAQWTINDDGKIVAQLTQHPLRLAWAITVHKSQGMTLDAAEIDLSKSFVEGMGYVALSRVRSLSGLKLLGLNEMALQVNGEVSRLDKVLIGISEKLVQNLKEMGMLKKWMKKREFMYKLTS